MRTPIRAALAGARANPAGAAGTGLVLALAACTVSFAGALVQSALRSDHGGPLLGVASSFASTGLVLVGVLVATTTTLALRARRREFALLRAIGATPSQVRGIVLAEIAVLGAICIPAGSLPGLVLVDLFEPALREAGVVDASFDAPWSPLPVIAAIALVLPIALTAGLVAARESARLAPTAALRASTVEEAPVGPVRLAFAVALGGLGLLTAFSPVVVPGTLGAASAGISALLLVGSAALGGPPLFGWMMGRLRKKTRRAPVRLAMGNLTGFSRRLAGVVVPLALVVAVGTMQSTVDTALHRATTAQLLSMIGTSRVAVSDQGLDRDDLATLDRHPGVKKVVVLGQLDAQVQTDDDADLPDAFRWETLPLRTLPSDLPASLLDPGVRSGSVAALDQPGTVAISSDLALEAFTGVGDELAVHFGDQRHNLRVVAVYDRGLALGPVLVGDATARGVDTVVTTALVDLRDGAAPPRGTVSTTSFATAASSPDAASQHLSALLTLLLLGFVLIGSLTSLIMLSAGRRGELQLLHRLGATAEQLRTMIAVEAAATGALAWVLGSLAVAPAVAGISTGLLGAEPPALDIGTYAALSSTVLVTAVAASLLPTGITIRSATRSSR